MKKALCIVAVVAMTGCCMPIQKKSPNYATLETNETTLDADDKLLSPSPEQDDYAEEFYQSIREISAQLMHNLNATGDLVGPVAVTTFVDLNHLYKTSPLGRFLAEGLMGELQRAGLQVTEIRKTQSILIREHFGEYSLSRDVKEISKHSTAEYLLVGTYIVRGDNIFINARLISNKDNLVVSSSEAHLKRNPFIDRMLWPSASPPETKPVTIPIKGLGEETTVEIVPPLK